MSVNFSVKECLRDRLGIVFTVLALMLQFLVQE